MGREKVVSFRATGWHVDRLNDLRSVDVPDGEPPRSASAVIRDAIAQMWRQQHESEPPEDVEE